MNCSTIVMVYSLFLHDLIDVLSDKLLQSGTKSIVTPAIDNGVSIRCSQLLAHDAFDRFLIGGKWPAAE